MYLQLWIEYSHRIWTTGTFLEKKVHKVLRLGLSDVIMWLHDLTNFKYFQLWIGYGNRIRLASTSFGEEFIGYSSKVVGMS